MKQAITIMAVVMAALLLASGFMVTNNVEQTKIITQQGALLTELRDKLQRAEKQMDEQSLNDETLSIALANMTEERDAAISALEESNAVATASTQALAEEKAARANEKAKLEDAIRQKQATMDELEASLQSAFAQRDEAITQSEGYVYELTAEREAAYAAALQNEDTLTQQEAMYEERLAELETRMERELAAANESLAAANDKVAAATEEAAAFAALIRLWNEVSLGAAEQPELDAATAQFRERYPHSELELPKQPVSTTAAPTASPKPTATPTPTASPKPTVTLRPAPTATPKPTPSTAKSVAPHQTLPPVVDDLP